MKGVEHMKFADDEELEQFIEIACMLKMYKLRGVPIPADIQDYFDRNRNKDDVHYVLHDIIIH